MAHGVAVFVFCIVVFLSVIAVVVHYLVVEARPNRSSGFIASMRRWRRR